jgi:predicted GIY-YIG superfamily endonuclease
MGEQRYVYVLLSTVYENRYYTGLTSDVQERLAAHNAGLSKHTANGSPWKLVATIHSGLPDFAADSPTCYAGARETGTPFTTA